MMGPTLSLNRTPDGGYIAAAAGNAFDKWDKISSLANWEAQAVLVKLDAAGNFQKKILYKEDTIDLGLLASLSILAGKHQGFWTLRMDSDRPKGPDNLSFANLRKYDDTGSLLWSRRYAVPVSLPMYGSASLHDLIQTPDGSIVIAGYYDNWSAGAVPPAQRGWLIKVDSNGCEQATGSCNPLSVVAQQASTPSFQVYPNPSEGMFTLSTQALPAAKEAGLALYLYDLTGRLILEQTIKAQNTLLDLRNYANGLYLYRVQQGTKTISYGKLVKQ